MEYNAAATSSHADDRALEDNYYQFLDGVENYDWKRMRLESYNTEGHSSTSLPNNEKDNHGVTMTQTINYDPNIPIHNCMSGDNETIPTYLTALDSQAMNDHKNQMQSESLSTTNADRSAFTQSVVNRENRSTVYKNVNNVSVPVGHFCQPSVKPIPRIKVSYAFKDLTTQFLQMTSGWLEIEPGACKWMIVAPHILHYKVDAGTGLVVLEDTTVEVRKNDVFVVQSRGKHSISNVGNGEKLILFFIRITPTM